MTDLFDDFVAGLRIHEMDPETARRQRSELERLVLGPQHGTGDGRVRAAGLRIRRIPRRRRAAVIAAGALLIAGTGVGTAAAFGAFSAKPTDRSTAYCYGTAQLTDDPAARIEFAVAGNDPNGTPGDAAAAALDICAAYWRAGVLDGSGPPRTDVVPGTGDALVPDLVACVLPTGQLAVFPGDRLTCARLGVADAIE